MNIGRVLKDVFPLLTAGIWVTIETTIIALLIAIVIGLVVCMAEIARNPV
jgi:polar amino acid transport system permease protein/polar amino acid transport system substrate-binding protein